jgi:hypothetical protein
MTRDRKERKDREQREKMKDGKWKNESAEQKKACERESIHCVF